MKQLKTITAAVLLAVTSGAASAAMYTPAAPVGCQGIGVTIPCERSAWDVGIEALYVQPSDDAAAFYGRRILLAFPGFNEANIAEVNEDLDFNSRWGWGFKLEGSYHFGTGNDININWTHFNKKSFQMDLGTTGVLQLPSFNLEGGFDSITGNRDIRFDAVNAEFGQHVDYGAHVNVRYHAGLQFARIRDDLAAVGAISFVIPGEFSFSFSDSTTYESRFDGVGPRIGADTGYSFGNGFSLVGRGAAALLVGTAKVNSIYFSQSAVNGIDLLTILNTTGASHRAIVPALEGRLGAKYDLAMASGDLIIEGGWLVSHYGHAVLRPRNVNSRVYQNHNFGFQGPYLGVKWVGNA